MLHLDGGIVSMYTTSSLSTSKVVVHVNGAAFETTISGRNRNNRANCVSVMYTDNGICIVRKLAPGAYEREGGVVGGVVVHSDCV